MKLRFFSIFALAGLLLSSCAVEEVPVTEHTILAVMEGDQTRTSVTDGGVFSWSAGDQVWLQTTNGSVVGTLSSGAGTSSAKFTYGGFVGEMTGKAVYPYNDGHSISGEVLNFVLPASYDLGSSLTNTNAAMYGVNVGGTIKFNHLAGVMRFKFKDVPAGVNKFTITLDKKINGTFTADLAEEYPVIETSSASAASEKTITLNFIALTAKSDISIYVPLPIGTYNSLELGLYDDSQAVWTYSKSVTNTVSRKSLKLMPVVTLGGSVNGDIEGDIEGDVVDLSENGTANCYIVNAAGKYYFNASVKGNGTESVGAPSTAETIWESFNSSTAPNVGDIINDVQFNNGIVSFTATGKEGNALIAVKNSSGTILWSWHIWATKYNPDTEFDTYKNYSNIKVMNRNLGALSSTAGDYRSLGFYYQWGRKDPLPSSSSISSYVMMSTTPSSVFNTVSNSSSVGTISYAVQHPTTAIKESSNHDWMYSPNSSLWSTKKTQYDPCPKGWKVPDISLFSSFTSTSDYSRDETNRGVKFGTSVSTPGAFFPCCGTIGGGDLSGGAGEFAISCHYWSNSGSRFCIYESSAPSTSYNTFRSHGFPVRCCAE